jgi:glycosyltransferase involved in cell wall biosynthesis
MACGAPVVASNASSLPEIAGDAALLAPPDDPAAHVMAIESLLTDQGLREKYSKRGKSRAAGFTWSASAAALKRHFDSLL